MALGITISTNMTVDLNLRVPIQCRQCATEPTLRYMRQPSKLQRGGGRTLVALVAGVRVQQDGDECADVRPQRASQSAVY